MKPKDLIRTKSILSYLMFTATISAAGSKQTVEANSFDQVLLDNGFLVAN
jgi:hypothetical protein